MNFIRSYGLERTKPYLINIVSMNIKSMYYFEIIKGVLTNSKDYLPLRIHCSWSKSISIINVTFVNISNYQSSSYSSKSKIIKQIT